jgi:hypothetical protein
VETDGSGAADVFVLKKRDETNSSNRKTRKEKPPPRPRTIKELVMS